MSLTAGDKLGPYEILRSIGAGGMVRCFEPGTRASAGMSPSRLRFLMLKPAAGLNAQSSQLHVVVNWYEELRRRVPSGK